MITHEGPEAHDLNGSFHMFRPHMSQFPATLVLVLTVQGVQVDPETRRVWRDGSEIRLSKKEFELLHALISRPGEIVTREQLMLEVWETTFWTSAKTIDVHLGWLRRKLGDDTRRPTLITTIRGRGLRFEESPPEYVDASQAS